MVSMDWIDLAQDKDWRRDIVNAVMELRVAQSAWWGGGYD